MPVLMELAKAYPDVSVMGAGLAENTDYSVTFVTGEPGELELYESHDHGDMPSAYRAIYGLARPNYDEDGELFEDEDDLLDETDNDLENGDLEDGDLEDDDSPEP